MKKKLKRKRRTKPRKSHVRTIVVEKSKGVITVWCEVRPIAQFRARHVGVSGAPLKLARAIVRALAAVNIQSHLEVSDDEINDGEPMRLTL